MTQPKHTLVIGGGVIGAFSAYYLQQAGRQVTIVDKGKFGAGCSHANCGYVSPSHVLPLPKPGQLGIGLKALFSNKGALRIRPGLSLSLWAWLLKFGSRCNRRDMLQAGSARTAILQSSRQLYQEIIEGEQLSVEWKTDGLLFVFRDKQHFEQFAETDRLLRTDFNVPAEAIDGAALAKMEPALKTGLAGAWHYLNDAHLRPDRLMSELQRRLQETGVTILEDQTVTKFVRRSDGVSAVVTASGEIAADEFVVATGPLTPMLNTQLDCRIPIQPGKGYSITMPRPKICPRYPMLLQEVHVGITPWDSGYRIGSTMELSGYNSEMNPQRLQYLRDGATEYLVDPLAEPVAEQWFGWRPMTWDGLPYIGRTPRFKNVWVAAGHNMLGLSMGTATGKLISELITDQKPHIDPHPYRIGRS